MRAIVRWFLGGLLVLLIFLHVLILAVRDSAVARATAPGRAVLKIPSAHSPPQRGDILDSWRGIPIRHNGEPYWKSHGRHFANSGYYFGKKWQCVEYVKRFYYLALNHEMPDVMGHAKSFFDPDITPPGFNQARGLWQYANGGGVPPRPDDLIVWRQHTYGHVAIITRVEARFIEVIQQNVLAGTRQRLPLTRHQGRYFVGEETWAPAGWLRPAPGS